MGRSGDGGRIAYCLGWLKTLYYYDAFGVGLSALELSPKDYLFESWFVLENAIFLWPEYLARVSLRVKEPNTPASGADGSELYVVFENEHRLFLWDRSGFTFGNPGGSIKMLTVPRDAVLSMQTTKPHRVQIGSLFF